LNLTARRRGSPVSTLQDGEKKGGRRGIVEGRGNLLPCVKIGKVGLKREHAMGRGRGKHGRWGLKSEGRRKGLRESPELREETHFTPLGWARVLRKEGEG